MVNHSSVPLKKTLGQNDKSAVLNVSSPVPLSLRLLPLEASQSKLYTFFRFKSLDFWICSREWLVMYVETEKGVSVFWLSLIEHGVKLQRTNP